MAGADIFPVPVTSHRFRELLTPELPFGAPGEEGHGEGENIHVPFQGLKGSSLQIFSPNPHSKL